MAEIVTFGSPLDPPRTVFRPSYLALDLYNQRIDVQLRDWNGSTYGDRLFIPTPYTGADAVTLIRALNKANLSTQSMDNRIMARLLADGKLPSGTVSGSPD
jgi:hypothetical protein